MPQASLVVEPAFFFSGSLPKFTASRRFSFGFPLKKNGFNDTNFAKDLSLLVVNGFVFHIAVLKGISMEVR